MKRVKLEDICIVIFKDSDEYRGVSIISKEAFNRVNISSERDFELVTTIFFKKREEKRWQNIMDRFRTVESYQELIYLFSISEVIERQ